jgi:hypothetical protein
MVLLLEIKKKIIFFARILFHADVAQYDPDVVVSIKGEWQGLAMDTLKYR